MKRIQRWLHDHFPSRYCNEVNLLRGTWCGWCTVRRNKAGEQRG